MKKSRSKKKSGTKKDACYQKVKRTYKVFPSAYASGAIAKCRKKRAGKKKEWLLGRQRKVLLLNVGSRKSGQTKKVILVDHLKTRVPRNADLLKEFLPKRHEPGDPCQLLKKEKLLLKRNV